MLYVYLLRCIVVTVPDPRTDPLNLLLWSDQFDFVATASQQNQRLLAPPAHVYAFTCARNPRIINDCCIGLGAKLESWEL